MRDLCSQGIELITNSILVYVGNSSNYIFMLLGQCSYDIIEPNLFVFVLSGML